MNTILLNHLLSIKYYQNNATIRYNKLPFQIETDYINIPNGLEKNEKGKWYIKAEIDPITKEIIEEINKLVINEMYKYWNCKISDCVNHSNPKEMYLKLKFRYNKFETKVEDEFKRPASIYLLNDKKKAKLRITLGSAFKEEENNTAVLLWVVEKIIF